MPCGRPTTRLVRPQGPPNRVWVKGGQFVAAGHREPKSRSAREIEQFEGEHRHRGEARQIYQFHGSLLVI